MSNFLLNCFVLGDANERVFTVEIAKEKTIGILKAEIKREKAPHLDYISASDLEVWKVDLPIDDHVSRTPQIRSSLRINLRLSSLWPHGPSDDNLHILIKSPPMYTGHSAPTPTFTLNCLLYNDINHYAAKGFTVEINANKTIGSLRDIVKEKTALPYPANSLTLFKVNLLVDDDLKSQLLSLDLVRLEPFSAKLSSVFDHAPDDHLHILVKEPRAASPTSRRTLKSQRELVVEQARKRDVPSAGSKNSILLRTQKEGKADAVYNGRPVELTAPPLSIYHPVFGDFKRKIAEPTDKASFSGEDLRTAHQFIVDSVAFYTDEDARVMQIQKALDVLVFPGLFWNSEMPIGNRTFRPDGLMRSVCEQLPGRDTAAYEFTEVKNGIGEAHSDPIAQAQCDYVAYYSDKARDRIRDACCCPAFLVGIAGPYLTISGAVFTDRFISQPFMEYMFLGGTPYLQDRIYDIAKISRALKSCLLDLKKFYAELPASPSRDTETPPSVFPHFRNFEANGTPFEIKYSAYLAPNHSEKAVFKASIQRDGEEHPVVVKFTPTYCSAAHRIAHRQNCAPKLWFCEQVPAVGGLVVVVMDLVDGKSLEEKSTASKEVVEQLRRTLAALHGQNYVYGDLRRPNVVVFTDKNGGDCAKLVDFDWGGEEGVVRYPADINTEIPWHSDVCPGALIRREHDEFMLQCLENGK